MSSGEKGSSDGVSAGGSSGGLPGGMSGSPAVEWNMNGCFIVTPRAVACSSVVYFLLTIFRWFVALFKVIYSLAAEF